jgi:DNA-binding CsgD family transcriptional regulator
MMANSELLRPHEVRDAYRLIGDCRDLGHDPALWHRRMFDGVCRLIGVPAATGGEGRWLRPHRPVEAISTFDSGLDARGRRVLMAFMRDLGPAGDPMLSALQQVPGPLVTRTRRQLISDVEYYRSLAFNEYLRQNDADHRLVSVCQVSRDGAVSVIALQRSRGERDFSPREQRLLDFFHGELGRLVRGALVSATEPSPDRLSPRLRQTLGCLLEGDSEKQVAARLGLSHATTHQYVTALYRHFEVQSRAQLLAHIFRRRRGARCPLDATPFRVQPQSRG